MGASQRCVERSGTMFSANKITGMTVVLSETLKEIIHKNDVSQDEHPFSALNCKKNQNVRYLATKPWEHVQRGEKPADAGLYPCSGYTGHVPAARETHGASYQSSIKLAQRASLSNTIRGGEHYADGGHFVSTQEVGSLAGGKQTQMPASATTSRRNTARGEPGTSRTQHSSRRSSAAAQNHGDVLGGDSPPPSHLSTGRSRYSGRGTARTDKEASRVKDLFDQLPPSRKGAILQELSSGWLQT